MSSLTLATPRVEFGEELFTDESVMHLHLAEPARVLVEVYDLCGLLRAVLFQGSLPAGRHEVIWLGMDNEGTPLPEGEYVLRASTDQGVHARERFVFER